MPQTVVDVGVGHGTSFLYEAFPDANFMLVEPLVEFEEKMKNICNGNNRFCYVLTGLGSKKERKKIQIDPIDLQRASFHERTKLTKTDSILWNRTI